MIIGIAPRTETMVSTLHTRVCEGSFLDSDSAKEVVLGYKLMKNLKVKVGDRVVILAQGYDGTLGNMAYRIKGALKTGSPEFDEMAVFMGLGDARELLGMADRVHVVALSMDELERIPGVSASISAQLRQRELDVVPWDRVSPELKKHMELDSTSAMIMLGILIVIVAFGILNTVLMSVTERFREFGVVLSMGMAQERLVMLVAMETLCIAMAGIVLGDLLAFGINYYLVVHPMVITGLESVEELLGIEYKLLSTVRPSVFINSSVAVLLISMLACVYPAYRVWRLEPLKGLRFT
jgi:ABC-type lipoprotein release transport system permease subunit